jgi:GDP-fucose transporter C1
LRIASVVALYFVVSISMVFVNKELLSGQTIPAPLFVTWFQCVVTIGICIVLGELSGKRCVCDTRGCPLPRLPAL